MLAHVAASLSVASCGGAGVCHGGRSANAASEGVRGERAGGDDGEEALCDPGYGGPGEREGVAGGGSRGVVVTGAPVCDAR